MKSVIIVHHSFEKTWPWAADHLHRLWQEEGETAFHRLKPGDNRGLNDVIPDTPLVKRLITLGLNVTIECLQSFTGLKECVIGNNPYTAHPTEEVAAYLKSKGVRVYAQVNEGYWGQSVSEFGLALTLCGLRRIPQTHHQMITSLEGWDYEPPGYVGGPSQRGEQFGDDVNFVNGTIEGKRIRIVGAGNIASRYASFVKMLGADVAAWDPYASDVCFHRPGSRKVWHLDQLMKDADIFVPMVPLTESTAGLITAEHIDSLPKGCLVVLVTRAQICDMEAVRRRVLADEISLAADVFDLEPLPLDDPLLGRHNVVHTPHNAGRTIHSNHRWSAQLAAQFLPAE